MNCRGNIDRESGTDGHAQFSPVTTISAGSLTKDVEWKPGSNEGPVTDDAVEKRDGESNIIIDAKENEEGSQSNFNDANPAWSGHRE